LVSRTILRKNVESSLVSAHKKFLFFPDSALDFLYMNMTVPAAVIPESAEIAEKKQLSG
jgi:hypothetical protein